jgi:hypothetical protein
MTTNPLSIEAGLFDRMKPCHEGEIGRNGSPSTLRRPRPSLSNNKENCVCIYYKLKTTEFKGLVTGDER